MDPRKVAASNNDTDLADDFVDEERILERAEDPSDIVKIVISDEQFTSPLEHFAPESAQPPAPSRSAVLDFGELPIVHGAGRPTASPAAPAVLRTSIRDPHSRQRAVRLVAIGTIAMALIVAGVVVMMHRFDVPNPVHDLAMNRTSAPAVIDVRAPAEAVHEAADAAPPSAAKIDSPSVDKTPVPSVKAVTTKSPIKVQQQRPQPTPKIAANAFTRSSGRQTAPPRPARSAAPPPRANVAARPSRAERAERVPPPVERARPAPPTTSSQQAIEESSRRALPADGAAPAVPAATSAQPTAESAAPPTSVASAPPSAPAAPAVPPAPVASATPSTAAASAARSAPAANAALSAVNRAPVASTPPMPGVRTDTRDVALTLNRYQQAFSSLDANAAHAVWPSVDVKALGKAFDQLEEQTFELEGCDINVTGARADADCAGNARYIRKVGNRALRVEPRHWHFRLRQTDEQWVIDAVDAR